MEVRFGIQQPRFTFPGEGPATLYPTLERIAQEAERAGFHSFWLMDHFLQLPFMGQGEEEPILEPWVTLGALARATQRILLGTLVTGIPYRNPALLAKMGATLDVISGGRLFLGVGAGWFQREFDAYGWPFPPRGERLRRLEEAVQVILLLWQEERPSFTGRYYTLRDARCEPRPLQQPRPPLLIGGGGEQVTLRLVARYADACNLFGDPPTVHRKLQALERHCQALGRDPATILKSRLGEMLIAPTEAEARQKAARYGVPPDGWQTIVGTPQQCLERCAQLLGAGLDYLIFSFPDAHTLEPLHLFMEEVAPALQHP